MKKLLLASVLLWALPSQAQSPVGPPNAILCNQIATFSAGTGADLQIVAAVTGQRIFICGWHITTTSAGSKTWAFDTGTGSNCATGKVALIPPQNVTSNAPSADHVDYAQIQTAQSVALCVNTDASAAGVVYFNQF